MDEVIKFTNEKLAEVGYSLEEPTIVEICERYGVKETKQVDDDFIKLILNLCEVHYVSDNDNTGGTSEKKASDINDIVENSMRGISEAVERVVDEKSSQIVQLYSNYPREVQKRVQEDLSHIEDIEKEGLFKFRNIIDFSVIHAQNEIESRRFTYRIMLVLVFLGLLVTFNNYGTNSDEQHKPITTTEIKAH